MLVLSRRPEQSLVLGDTITVTILSVDGDRVKLGIEAPRTVSILRHEIYLQVKNANAAAAATRPTAHSVLEALRNRQLTQPTESPQHD